VQVAPVDHQPPTAPIADLELWGHGHGRLAADIAHVRARSTINLLD
jgi:hypothetical protein